ncbi:hypothetical protein AB0M00_19490 [Streptomyces chartreusis]|uniref:hypothetical protein n=1 Tax=Streptomyces chartreusis TaxID=1969 RepID=UPI00341CF9E8
MANEALQAALGERYDALSTSLRDRVVQFVLDAFDSLTSYRDRDATAFIEQVLPIVLAAQQRMGQITDAYLSAMIADELGVAAPAVGVQLGEALRGTPPEEVYHRPFVTAYTALSQGKSYAEAVSEGRTRLLSITETDMQLARTHAARQSMQRGGAQFYRRDLKSSKSCALCVIASTQRYRVADLMPIHPGCHCKPVPIPGNRDPGHVLDEDLLREAHAAIAKGVGASDAGGRAPDYRKIIITREHGEYGPLLAVARHDFTGPRDLPGS